MDVEWLSLSNGVVSLLNFNVQTFGNNPFVLDFGQFAKGIFKIGNGLPVFPGLNTACEWQSAWLDSPLTLVNTTRSNSSPFLESFVYDFALSCWHAFTTTFRRAVT